MMTDYVYPNHPDGREAVKVRAHEFAAGSPELLPVLFFADQRHDHEIAVVLSDDLLWAIKNEIDAYQARQREARGI